MCEARRKAHFASKKKDVKVKSCLQTILDKVEDLEFFIKFGNLDAFDRVDEIKDYIKKLIEVK